MTLAATLLPAAHRHGHGPGPVSAGQAPAEHLARLLAAIVPDGNIRAMEGVACVLARADAVLADAMLERDRKACRLPLPASPGYRMAERTARRALAGAIADPTRGADRFHRLGDLPDWARHATPTVQLGAIVFYRAAPGAIAAGGCAC